MFRRGYTDSPRNRSYVIMNNVLYHLHPVKVKRHAVKVSYTLCLGGLSFFLFILLTVTGIFLMFFYRPTAAPAWPTVQHARDRGHVRLARAEHASMGGAPHGAHRVPAHGRVFYHGAYKAPREFNWVIGVILLTLTLLLSFTGYLLPVGPARALGRHRRHEHDGVHAGLRCVGEVSSCSGSKEISNETLLRWYVLHVLLLPFVIVIFMAVHFWRVRKDGGISGPL